MNRIDYNLGILKRLIAGSINNRPYVMLDDVEYIIKNSGIMENENKFMKPIEGTIMDFLDRRPTPSPVEYDGSIEDYYEWFIKGTNIKLGYDYYDRELGEQIWCRIVTESYDDQITYKTEQKFLEDIDWLLSNKELTWRYYE